MKLFFSKPHEKLLSCQQVFCRLESGCSVWCFVWIFYFLIFILCNMIHSLFVFLSVLVHVAVLSAYFFFCFFDFIELCISNLGSKYLLMFVFYSVRFCVQCRWEELKIYFFKLPVCSLKCKAKKNKNNNNNKTKTKNHFTMIIMNLQNKNRVEFKTWEISPHPFPVMRHHIFACECNYVYSFDDLGH